MTASVSDDFLERGRAMGVRNGFSFTQLLFAMNHESGLSPAAFNPHGGASGLIQFMPETLSGLGWSDTPEEFRQLSASQQLPFVEAFFRDKAKKNLDSVGRIHQAMYVPASLDLAEGPDDVIAARGGKRYGGAEGAIYEANRQAFDPKNLGYITPRMMEEADLKAAKERGGALQAALLRLRTLHPEDFRAAAWKIALAWAAMSSAGLAAGLWAYGKVAKR